MIDTHCHLLPGLDDGPGTVAEAVELARSLVQQGVARVICTPHWSSQFPTSADDVAAALQMMRSRLAELGIDLQLDAAAELSEAYGATRPLDEIRRRTIAGRYVVVELVRQSLPAHADVVCRRLVAEGLVPILAHPERCEAVRRDNALVDGWRDAGALVQVVAPSLTRPGTRSYDAAWSLLAAARVDLVASDAHDCDDRGCELASAGERVAALYGDDLWEELTVRRPGSLL